MDSTLLLAFSLLMALCSGAIGYIIGRSIKPSKKKPPGDTKDYEWLPSPENSKYFVLYDKKNKIVYNVKSTQQIDPLVLFRIHFPKHFKIPEENWHAYSNYIGQTGYKISYDRFMRTIR